jgi:peroxiredoxin
MIPLVGVARRWARRVGPVRLAVGVGVVLAGLLGAVGLAGQPGTTAAAVVEGVAGTGRPAPRVELPDFQGRRVRLADLRGRPVVVNFWASWCPGCAAEMPDFERVHRRLGDQVAFLGIAQRDTPGRASASARRTGVTYQLAVDASGRAFDAFGSRGMPTTVLIRADGTVAEVVTGQLDEERLTEQIRRHLGVGPGSAAGTTAPAARTPLVEPDELVSGGPPPDGIPPLDRPRFLHVGRVDWLAPAEPVAVVRTGGDARAYPLQILVWHEIVNDTIGGSPVAVTYCPLCNTAVAFRRPEIGGKATTFGTSGKLYNSNLVMYDRATQSLWPQALGLAVSGPLTGQRLARLPAQIVAWSDFRASFPAGRVLSRETGFQRPYGHNPYPLYDRKGSSPFLYHGTVDGRLEAVERVLGLSAGERHLAVPYPRLAGRARGDLAAVNLDVGGTPALVLWRAGAVSALDEQSIARSRAVGAAAAFARRLGGRTLTFRAEGGRVRDHQTSSTWNPFGLATAGPLAGSQLPAVTAMDSFWFDWAAFHPDTAIWEG